MRLPIALAAAMPLLLSAQQAPPRPQQPPLIRSQVTIVPIDVRVIGRDGKPVTDLTADDFVILEDGVPQAIKHFSSQAFTADAAAPDTQPAFRRAIEDTTATPNRRVFLIMLGRGRHQAVSKYVDALSDFVTRLMPQDQVALMAWNRATDFTPDHSQTLRTLTAYKQRSEKIETQLREWFSGLRAVYGSPDIPAFIQREIDSVFSIVPELRPRELAPPDGVDGGQRLGQTKRAAEEIQRNEIMTTFPGAGFLPDTRSAILAELAEMPFDEYVSKSSETLQDLGGLYRAIDYLRYLEGEKHIVFLTERGIDMPLLPGNRTLANVAADARIAINIVQTGGVVGAAPARVVIGPNGSNVIMSPLPSSGALMNQSFSTSDLRTVAEVTGGRLSAYTRGPVAFERLTESLGFQYLIAYAPTRAATDGSFRKIEIKVRRPGVQVQYRRGYFASPRVIPLDRRDFVTFTRIRGAARYDKPIEHIRVTLTQAVAKPDSKTMEVQITVDVSKLSLPMSEGMRTGSLEVAMYLGDERGRPVGESLSRADFKFTEEAFQRALQNGAPFTVPIEMRGKPARVKAVVYDYGADLLGTVTAKLPLKTPDRN